MTRLSRLSSDSEETSSALDALLNWFEIRLPPNPKIGWTGLSCVLDATGEKEDDGHGRCALALWHLALDRWLPLIECVYHFSVSAAHVALIYLFSRLASKEQTTRFAKQLLLHLSDDMPSNASGIVTPNWVVQRAMASAAFWELPALRSMAHIFGSSAVFLP